MAANDTTSFPKDLSKLYYKNIDKNIQKILRNCKYSQKELVDFYKNLGLNIAQGTISKYMSGAIHIQFSFIILTCELFNIPIYTLTDENFEYNIDVDLKKSVEKIKNSHRFKLPDLGTSFVTNPQNDNFNGYLQTYYCYFFPTLSSENKILEGILKLEPKGNYCSANLTLNTNKTKNGIAIEKTYTGFAIISTAVESCYIFLSSPIEGEISVINLRHFLIRHQQLDCRMAEVITNGAGERHFPVVHRLLLSREQIKNKEHLEYLAPHLHLSSNNILIPKKNLEKLKEESDEYERLVKHLTSLGSSLELYNFKENYVVTNAEQILPKSEVQKFLSIFRNNSYNVRYNKVSNKLDETVRELLLSLGYYQDTFLEE